MFEFNDKKEKKGEESEQEKEPNCFQVHLKQVIDFLIAKFKKNE